MIRQCFFFGLLSWGCSTQPTSTFEAPSEPSSKVPEQAPSEEEDPSVSSSVPYLEKFLSIGMAREPSITAGDDYGDCWDLLIPDSPCFKIYLHEGSRVVAHFLIDPEHFEISESKIKISILIKEDVSWSVDQVTFVDIPKAYQSLFDRHFRTVMLDHAVFLAKGITFNLCLV